MDDDSQYITYGFEVTDSTLVITKLDEYDTRYVRGREIAPISLLLRDVKTIEKTEVTGLTIDVAVLLGCAVLMLVLIAHDNPFGGFGSD